MASLLHYITLLYIDSVTLTLHNITLHFTFHLRIHLPVPRSTHAHGFIMLPPRQPRVLARRARWQLPIEPIRMNESGRTCSALMTRCGTDLRHQYGIFCGKSQTSFTRNTARAGSEAGRLFSQAEQPGPRARFLKVPKSFRTRLIPNPIMTADSHIFLI